MGRKKKEKKVEHKNRRESASQKKKAKIISTTMQLLLKKGGSTSTSTSDVCAAAKLTRPTLYHYFGSKRNLLLSVHMDSIEKTLKPYLNEASSIKNPSERLNYMVYTFTKEIICKHPELRVLIHDTFSMKDKYFKEVREIWKEHYRLLKDTITELQSEGRIDPSIKPSWATLFVLGMLTWITYWLDYSRNDELEELAQHAVKIVHSGLSMK
ncbi:MAG: TetR/AcrR family transcriptional regulator [Syntrophorhabdaceae bacterium]|nr:TetR/AcrR family transcriptional regulator [Syntrophorhabdaceae bacterium]